MDSLSDRARQIVARAASGEAQKLIAYNLRLSVSTVGQHLTAAARKVGLGSRVALLAAWRPDHGDAKDAGRLDGTSRLHTEPSPQGDNSAVLERLTVLTTEHNEIVVIAFALPNPTQTDPAPGLTPAESSVLLGVLVGLSNKSIAAHRRDPDRQHLPEVGGLVEKRARHLVRASRAVTKPGEPVMRSGSIRTRATCRRLIVLASWDGMPVLAFASRRNGVISSGMARGV